ncbi:MAG: hypothetical protein GXP54_09295, partial [Deltaproteobacteria bacterium]|nr:hypothetical protein [Deltaproteobacteria bacterium]
QEPKVGGLIEQGSGFGPDDRNFLVDKGMELIGKIVPLYRELSESGQVELSASPFYHPLSPLLLSSSSAREADPAVVLPEVRFAAPGELDRQVRHGLDYFQEATGIRPEGMWPPEGAVSEDVIRAYRANGVKWVASDEEILKRSLGGEASQAERLRPYQFEGVTVFFRNREISDHIGFVYSRWPAARSVGHFMKALEDMAGQSDDDAALCVVALDGENAWEFYPDGGYPFLEKLYGAVEASDIVESVTFSDYIRKFGRGEPLDQLATGSWIDGNLDTWIGDPVKNRAWDYLTSAYQAVRDVPGARCLLESEKGMGHAKGCRLMRAEASDWFWWFGRGHDSVHEREFDYLFRQNLRMIYKDLGLTTPDYLSRPVDDGWAPVPVTPPTAYISPVINGRNDGFYKWVGAGKCEFRHGSIHRQRPLVSSVSFGFDHRDLYFRVEGFEPLVDLLSTDGWIKFHFAEPDECAVVVLREAGDLVVEKECVDNALSIVDGGRAAVEDVFEMALPVSFFESSFGSSVPLDKPFAIEFCVVLGQGDLELERFPWDSVIAMEFDPQAFEMENWFV